MPIYEFQCKACETRFEEWVRKEGMTAEACPACGGKELERLLSTPSVHSEGVKQLGLKAARKRDKILGTEREYTQREYELHHND